MDINEQLFWSKVKVGDENECWPYMAGHNGDGYGQFCVNRQSRNAHRVAFVLAGGVLSDDKNVVCHRCDNPECCNPNHLFAGSNIDNIADKVLKNRQSRLFGESNHSSKLTASDIANIRGMAGTISQRKIASIYHVSQSMVSNILLGKNWANI